MAIQNIPIRAQIYFGKDFHVDTPYILSFSVNKNRMAPSTFQASLKVRASDLESMQGVVTISAGIKDNLNLIYTGYIKSIIPSPCWDDPSYFVVSISGVDELYKLENRKFTRRQIISDKIWVVIDGVVAAGKTAATLKYTGKAPSVKVTDDNVLELLSQGNKNINEPHSNTNPNREKQESPHNIDVTVGHNPPPV